MAGDPSPLTPEQREAAEMGEALPAGSAFDADLSEALSSHNMIITEQPERRGDPTLPGYRLVAKGQIEWSRSHFAGGNKFALMRAIYLCAHHGLPMPAWVAAGCVAAYGAVADAKSWDDVFGRPHRKGTNREAQKKRARLELPIVCRVQAIRDSEPGSSLGAVLFERVGEEFNIGKTAASDIYYNAPAWMRKMKIRIG